VQFRLNFIDDIAGDIQTISPSISPAVNSQNRAQNYCSGDTSDTGDIKHIIQSDKQEDDHSKTIYRLGR
jgi:hypothetical protein